MRFLIISVLIFGYLFLSGNAQHRVTYVKAKAAEAAPVSHYIADKPPAKSYLAVLLDSYSLSPTRGVIGRMIKHIIKRV